VLVVSPNNPTGSLLRADDRDWLWEFCARRNLSLIGDEVFADYPLTLRPDAAALLDGNSPVLAFALGGLSKSAGLPQVKLAWMALGGPDPLVAGALERLELICDTYLSVSTPVQVAAPALLASGAAVRGRILDRVTTNLRQLRDAVTRHSGISLLEPDAGWSAVLRVPSIESEDALVLRLLDEAGVLVHPGYFFDFPREAYLVLSLIVEPGRFAAALDRLLPIAEGSR
jgi:aspartate/methionine/tyrosine aminotransferase